MSTLKTNEEVVAEIQKGIDVEENKVQLFTQSRGILVFFCKVLVKKWVGKYSIIFISIANCV